MGKYSNYQINGTTEVETRNTNNINFDEEAGDFPQEEDETLLEEQQQEEEKEEKEEKEEGDELWDFAPYSLQREKEEGREVVVTQWKGAHILAYIGGMLIFSIFFFLFSFFYFVGTYKVNAAEIILLFGFPWLWIGGWPLYLSWSQGNGPMLDFGITYRPKDFGWGILAGLAAIGVNFLVVFLCQIAFGFMTPLVWIFVKPAGITAAIALVLVVGVGYPIFDEILFRGLFFTIICQKAVSKKKSSVLVILLSSFLSAILHVELWRAPIYFCVALVFGSARVFSESVTAPIIAHMMCSTTIMIITLVYVEDIFDGNNYGRNEGDFGKSQRDIDLVGSLWGY